MIFGSILLQCHLYINQHHFSGLYLTLQSPANSVEFQHLLARIHRRYQTVTQSVRLCDHSFEFTRIKDPNRVLDEIVAEEDRLEKASGKRKISDQLRLPYWAEIWDSALGISQVLIKKYTQLNTQKHNSSVLDLGCGQGFTGMVAASLGCNVLFADLEPHALLFAKLNSLRFTTTARTQQLNWQTAQLGERFDLIIGADILYERKQWDFLEPFWLNHLKPDGQVLLGEPGRHTGDNFPEWITARNWNLQIHHEPVSTKDKPIRLFELSIVRKM